MYFSRAITLLKGPSALHNDKKVCSYRSCISPCPQGSFTWKMSPSYSCAVPCAQEAAYFHVSVAALFSVPQSTPGLLQVLLSSRASSMPNHSTVFLTLGSCSSLSHLFSPHLHANVWSHAALAPHWLYVTPDPCPLLPPCYFLLPQARATTASLLAAPG